MKDKWSLIGKYIIILCKDENGKWYEATSGICMRIDEEYSGEDIYTLDYPEDENMGRFSYFRKNPNYKVLELVEI